jgi:hypothetical protein
MPNPGGAPPRLKIPPGRGWPLLCLVAMIGLLPVVPILLKRSPVLNNDMLVAYFCYFWDFHKNWSWTHPLVFWSSSYQLGMPMHAYWQSGYLYPITWILFGPLSPHYGIYLFYAFHFALGIFGFLKLGPHLHLRKPASLWAGICFALSGTMLARYEHATFLAGWAWMPLVLSAFLTLRDRPGPGPLFAYALAVCLQAVGGHPQASIVTALLIAAFTVTSLLLDRIRSPRGDALPAPGAGGSEAGPAVHHHGPAAQPPAPPSTRNLPPSPPRRAAWLLGGHLLALLYCAPLVIPFMHLVNETDRYDGTAWEAGKASEISAAEKLEEGVFSFRKFSTGGLRPLHLLSLVAPHALGTPSHASWWGGEVWGEVFLYLGGLGLFFCFRGSWRRAGFDLRVLWIAGLVSLWFAAGAHFGASQMLYHLPVINNFRRPARFGIVFVMALAALSGHGFQRWNARPHAPRRFWIAVAGLLCAAALLFALRHESEALVDWARHLKPLDPSKNYAGKIATLLGDWAADACFLAVSAAALAHCAPAALRNPSPTSRSSRRHLRSALLIAVLLADLLRLHWDHFYRFPASFYRTPPASAAVLDAATAPFWRVSHYLEYPGLEMWNMHNDPLAHLDLFEREKNALSCGIHAVFGYRHVSAHLPLLWKWNPSTSPAGKATRYLFANADLEVYKSDSLRALGRFGEVRAYELKDWRPRIELLRGQTRPRASGDSTACPPGYFRHADICAREDRDGEISMRADLFPGDTLLIRERFQREWRFRVNQGKWIKPVETPDHFIALPVNARSTGADLTYVPGEFYRIAGVGVLVSALLLILFPMVSRRKHRA